MPKYPPAIQPLIDEDTVKAWRALNVKQRAFFIHYINNQFNATRSYLKTYNPNADNNTAKSGGSQILANRNLQLLCSKLAKTQDSDLLRIKQVLNDGMQSETIGGYPDHDLRRKCSMDLAKLNGQLVERSRQEIFGEIAHKHIYELPKKEILNDKKPANKIEP